MAALVGLAIGAILGQIVWHEWGAAIGGLAGFLAGALIAGRRQRELFRKPDMSGAPSAEPDRSVWRNPAAQWGTAPANGDAALAARIAALEARVAALEGAHLRGLVAAGEVEPAEAMTRAADGTTPMEVRVAPAGRPGTVPTDAPELQDAGLHLASAEEGQPQVPKPDAPQPGAGPRGAEPRGAVPVSPFWAWLTGGNALTRIGVVVLFFGVAFLLRYFTERFTIPLELRLGGVAAFGGALIALGLATARRRPGYGLSLQGAGCGVLYLTIYASSRLYSVLPEPVAVALLVATAVLTVVLALRADAQVLAALAVAGAFLAPLLAGTPGGPLALFGYFALVNLVVFGLAWYRSWRALNVLGFVFTFVLGLFWGSRFYRPAHFTVVEPFLAGFFLAYVIIAILEARRGNGDPRNPVDATLVFGVPLAGFVLQAALVDDLRYGAAWSAFVLALFYAALHAAFRRSVNPGLVLLARAFLALGIVFLTLAVPLAFDDQWTVALWAIEGAGVYWLGTQQRSVLARGFGLLVQLGAGMAFLHSGGPTSAEPMLANGHFIGGIVLALAALATARVADRAFDSVHEWERPIADLVFGWGALWWLGTGVTEFVVQFDGVAGRHAALAWVVGTVVAGLVLAARLPWFRLAAFGLALLPAMAAAAAGDFHWERTTLLAWGGLLWPAAWITLGFALQAGEDACAADRHAALRPWLRFGHILGILGLVTQACWEASEWTGRWTDPDTVWMACAAALPAIAGLWLLTMVGGGRWHFAWPGPGYRSAWSVDAGRAVFVGVSLWFVAANVLSPGNPAPLPYVPGVNPLDLCLVLALGVGFAWGRNALGASPTTLYVGLGVALFVLLNGVVLRTGHHWMAIPWRLQALLASKPLQAALTLTWTVTALALMLASARRRVRPLWLVGAALLGVVMAKLFLLDLSALSGLPRIVAFLGVGVLMLAIGYVAPLPPARLDDETDQR